MRATDNGGGIEDIRLYHNGKLISSPPAPSAEGGSKTRTALFKVDLVAGANTLKATAYNKDKTMESVPCEVSVNCTAAQKGARQFILAVGVSQYKNPGLSLNFASKDADEFAALVEGKGKKIFDAQYRKILLDKDATKDTIVRELKEISQKAEPQDVVILYFSGHGDIDESDNQFYFIPFDFNINENIEVMYKSSGLACSTIAGMTKETKAKKILMVFDTCHAGAATVAFRGMSEIKAMKMLGKTYGVHIIAASTDKQKSGEEKALGHGFLTYALIKGLEGSACSGDDGIVTVFNLIAFIQNMVPDLAEKYLGVRQTPITEVRGMDFPLVVK
ncbi:MAG: caspase domain-containing protein [Candidatus Xenobiia bacterium LiM19]